MNLHQPSTWTVTPFRIALAYLIFGLSALIVSDLVLPMVLTGATLRAVQGIKGAVEVLLTALVLYGLLWVSWEDLRLKEQAIDAAPIGITISDPDQADNPLIFANQQFQSVTGYDESEALGRNCRFLQGEETDPETRAQLRQAIDTAEPVSVDIRNYRKNGELFWNKVDIAPVRDENGEVTNFVGFQTDITERKLRAQRLAVLNRVLRHNCRNRINVVEGYLSVLRDDIDDADMHEMLDTIDGAIDDFESVVETVRQVDSVFQVGESSDQHVHLNARIREITDALQAQHPQAELSVSVGESEKIVVKALGISDAIREAVENAIVHAETETPAVTVRVTRPRDQWVAIEIQDNGPGIPEEELAVLRDGETPLMHGTQMGLWMIHWVIRRAGGSLTVETAADTGTTLTLSVPTTASHPINQTREPT